MPRPVGIHEIVRSRVGNTEVFSNLSKNWRSLYSACSDSTNIHN